MQHIRELLKQGPDEAYGLNICESMTNDLRAIVDLAQIYVVLKRLGEEGRRFLTSRKVPAPSGSGHTVTAYTITPDGEVAMEQAALFYDRLYRGGAGPRNGSHFDPPIKRRGK
jgi:DNA-binding PadR family transcriptional regulator